MYICSCYYHAILHDIYHHFGDISMVKSAYAFSHGNDQGRDHPFIQERGASCHAAAAPGTAFPRHPHMEHIRALKNST